jgi:hypothetical protein
MAKQTYEVLSPLLHDGKRYEPGKTISLEEDAAAGLVANGTLGAPSVAERPSGEAKASPKEK